ncbi:MAG: membrane protein [Candidatus Syntrophoarchaeum caldarius]|uniref:Membrane protein n=1 Tax=Candidatus Syntropharchaeum caldarium TaxID=1838285 RepID=A0A1F2P7R8_9EURY|nr:MAG: membrane protein [Candidatus Syntrophoarchaeum caldarius]
MNKYTAEGLGYALEIVTSVVVVSFLGLLIAGWRPGEVIEGRHAIGLFLGAITGFILSIYSVIKKYQQE